MTTIKNKLLSAEFKLASVGNDIVTQAPLSDGIIHLFEWAKEVQGLLEIALADLSEEEQSELRYGGADIGDMEF